MVMHYMSMLEIKSSLHDTLTLTFDFNFYAGFITFLSFPPYVPVFSILLLIKSIASHGCALGQHAEVLI